VLRAKVRVAKSIFLMARSEAATSMSTEHEVLERIHESLESQN